MKQKKALTKNQKLARKLAKAERQKKFEWIFVKGKQKRIRRPQLIEGLEKEEFIRQNADDLWLHQNEMWHIIDERQMAEQMPEKTQEKIPGQSSGQEDDDDIPF